MRFTLILLIIFFSKITSAELLKPNTSLMPKEVISIQLFALQNNNILYKNAGIEQTWTFAHPSNRKFTGPLQNFISMMYSTTYSLILDHHKHNIIPFKKNKLQAFFFVELIDKTGTKVGFQWIVQKVINDGEFKNCWMTTSVSQPFFLSKST